MQYIWLCVLITSIIVEALVPGLVSIWFVPAALVAIVLDFFNIPTSIQIIVFLAISLALIVLSKTIWKKYVSKNRIEPTNSDALIGKPAVVTKTIDNINSLGEVKINGQYWSARSETDENIDVGSIVTVSSIVGVKLICKK